MLAEKTFKEEAMVEMVEGTGVLRRRRKEMKGQDKHMQNSE